MRKLDMFRWIWLETFGSLGLNKKQKKSIGTYITLIIFIGLGQYYSVWFTVFGVVSHFVATYFLLNKQTNNRFMQQLDSIFGD